MPPPTIMLRGAWSLNRNSSPGCRARKFAADGAQKLTSARFGCRRSMSNQSPSVTAMTRLRPILFRLNFTGISGRKRLEQTVLGIVRGGELHGTVRRGVARIVGLKRLSRVCQNNSLSTILAHRLQLISTV